MHDAILGVIATIAVFYFLQKSRSVDAQAENLETKEKLAEVDKTIALTEASLEVEEHKRETLTEEMEKKTNEVLSPEEIADFFNKRK